MQLAFNLYTHFLRHVMLRFALFLVLVLPVSIFLLPELARAENLTGQLQFAEGTYRINVGDILSVDVYNQGDLSGDEILVRPDGNATFKGIGEIQVAGKTIREATLLIDSQVRELVREPRISLTVKDAKPPSVYLAGAVMRPGLLQAGSSVNLPTNMNGNGGAGVQGGSSGGVSTMPSSRVDFHLSSVLAAAGGVRLNADLANVSVSRDGELYKTVNLWDLIKTGQSQNDILLQNGDSIYVPELPKQALDDQTYQLLLASAIGPQSFPVRLIGDVKNPGVYDLNSTSPYLNSVIAKGGGYNYGANRRSIAIRRFTSEHQFTTLFVNPSQVDFMLRPNDVIYVAEGKLAKSGRFGENVAQVLAPFNSASSAIFSFALLGGVR